jgi:hypothetical protein
MRPHGILLFILLVAMLNAADEESTIRSQENALAQALTDRDKVLLDKLTEPSFTIFWTDNESAERTVSATSLRDEWLDDLLRLRPAAYKAVISKVLMGHHLQAIVFMEEQWTIPLNRTIPLNHGRMQKRFRTIDSWWLRDGTWKLGSRSSQTISTHLKLPSSQ